MRARHHLLAGAAVLLLAMPAAALAQAEYSQYPPIPGLIDEVKAGTLSQADYDKLVAIRDQGAERISDSAVRASARSTANSETVKTVMGNINAEITESVKNGDAEAVVDASLNGGHAMTTQVTMPGIANAGVVIDDMVDVMRKVYQARAQMAGANRMPSPRNSTNSTSARRRSTPVSMLSARRWKPATRRRRTCHRRHAPPSWPRPMRR
ncbi:MAG: hypothetical protein WDN06_05565 [Asticcacaulis sp.]